MRVRLKGVNSRTKRLADGSLKTYYWAWKGGPPLPGKPGSPEFIAAYNAAVAEKVAIMINGRLVVQSCPFCARYHVHTAEEGLRLAPCATSGRPLEYRLTRRDE